MKKIDMKDVVTKGQYKMALKGVEAKFGKTEFTMLELVAYRRDLLRIPYFGQRHLEQCMDAALMASTLPCPCGCGERVLGYSVLEYNGVLSDAHVGLDGEVLYMPLPSNDGTRCPHCGEEWDCCSC